MDQKELALAIQQICDEKGLTPEDVKITIEDALAAAYRKDFGDKKTQNIKTEFNLATGDFKVFDIKEVVKDELKETYEKIKAEIDKLKEEGKEITSELLEELQGKPKRYTDKSQIHADNPNKKTANTEDMGKKQKKNKSSQKISESPVDNAEDSAVVVEEEKKFNPRTMISLKEAKEIKKGYKLGDEVITKLDVPAEFGRMAAQTAKQVIIQKIREAERNTVYNEFKDRVGDLMVGTVQRQEGKVILVDLGSTTGVVLPIDQIRTDKYISGARMKFYVKSVEQTNKGPEVLISRSHPEMLRKLFKLEVPEVNSGTVIIKVIARDAGGRAKIAVFAKEEGLDPIGTCIGQRGNRVQTIINELGGEKIDIIEWDENINKFVENALAPAKILKIEINKEEKIARAVVAEDQYSLAIGKGGQNVRLAAQLVGMKIDVVMENSTQNPDNNKQEKNKKDEKTANTEDTEKTLKTQKKIKNSKKNSESSEQIQSPL